MLFWIFNVNIPRLKKIHRIQTTQVEAYGTSTVVFIPYFAVIQAGELRPYF